MPWKEMTPMSQRQEFVRLAMADGAGISRLCRCLGVSRKTGYKWLSRYVREGDEVLADRSRRPRSSPWHTPPQVEEAVLGIREGHRLLPAVVFFIRANGIIDFLFTGNRKPCFIRPQPQTDTLLLT